MRRALCRRRRSAVDANCAAWIAASPFCVLAPAGPGGELLGAWYADVLRVSRDSATFSSARAGYMVQDMDPPAVSRAC
jgi:hypothetical protein